MIPSKQANERLWDALIKEALIQDCCNELAELEKSVSPHTFSERFEKNISRMKRRIFGKKRLKSAGVVLRNIAAVVMLVIVLTSGVLLNQPEVHTAVENVIDDQVRDFVFVKLDFLAMFFMLINTVLYGCIIFIIIFIVYKIVYSMIKKHKSKSEGSDDKQEKDRHSD